MTILFQIKKEKLGRFDSEGPQEISNCTEVLSKRDHFYIRSVKSKPEENVKATKSSDKNDNLTCSTPFENNQDKWFFNKTDSREPKRSLSIGGKYKN